MHEKINKITLNIVTVFERCYIWCYRNKESVKIEMKIICINHDISWKMYKNLARKIQISFETWVADIILCVILVKVAIKFNHLSQA